jgi:hypothetical protein
MPIWAPCDKPLEALAAIGLDVEVGVLGAELVSDGALASEDELCWEDGLEIALKVVLEVVLLGVSEEPVVVWYAVILVPLPTPQL